MNQRFWFTTIAIVLVFGNFVGCANMFRRTVPKEAKTQGAVEPIRIQPPKQPRGLNPSEIEVYLNRGKSKWVKVPREVLKEWVKLEKQQINECKIVEEQLQAIKAIDMEKWKDAKSEEADFTSR